MIGIIVELLLSWLLLWLFERRHLSALGLLPTRQRILAFLQGFLLPIVYLAAFYWIVSGLVKNPYRLNPHYTWKGFESTVAYLLRSVAYEDLIFRGALLYILIRRIGPRTAVLASAISFGIYHWFSFSVFGQPMQMGVVFITTGMVGYVFALAFEKTRSVYLPFALHFGVNFAIMILFSQDKGVGPQLLLKTFEKDPATPGTVVSLLVMVVYFIGLPLLLLCWLRWIKPVADSQIAAKKN